MKILNCLLLVLSLTATENATAQTKLKKIDARLQQLQLADADIVAVVIRAKDAAAVAQTITNDGYRARAIGKDVVSARVPARYLPVLEALDDVAFVKHSQQLAPMMTEARAMSNVDYAHQGYDLDSPYKGKGVIIGVIDQGFEYRHIAFLDEDGQTRVRAVWNRTGYSKGTDSEPITDIPATGDGISSTAHATHVTGIAAGSVIAENDYYGVAPEAEIIMIPSEFNEAEILEDVDYIAGLARDENKPWVINMSFGGQIDPHDATTYSYRAIDDIITERPGGMIVVAIGNDGLTPMHAQHTFAQDGETVRIATQPSTYGTIIDLWCQQADSASHLQVKPFIYYNQKIEYLDDEIIAQVLTHQIAPNNKKENFFAQASATAINSYAQGALFGLEITGEGGVTFHAWTTSGYGQFSDGPDDTFVKGDNDYSVAAPASAMPHCVSVASYNSLTSYVNFSGRTQVAGYGDLGDISTFSNSGPSLHGTPQPTVAAPGAMVRSALSKYEMGFTPTNSYITDDVKRGLKHFYYGAYAGTSMATPMVTGAVALWLQANPNLTHGQIHDIIAQTSKKDEFTGDDDWNPRWGYGKLDVYEGLRMALSLAGEDGMPIVNGAAQPVTLLKGNDTWRVLMGSNEQTVQITVFDVNGVMLSDVTVNNVTCGQEITLPVSQLRHGSYLVRIKTPCSVTTRKLAV